jgi:hypothetical protein
MNMDPFGVKKEIMMASAYEAATHHRVPPPMVGPVSVQTKALASVSVTASDKEKGAAQ